MRKIMSVDNKKNIKVNKQKQIEKMENIIEKTYEEYQVNCSEYFAEALYNAGCRIRSEVAKEIESKTVKKIFSFIVNNCHLEYSDITNLITFLQETFNLDLGL